ncbi:hypothetical protein ES332_A09G039900v1 [Gossypium tomentosum]|uniref:Uncharacterized protein n=1 Tax=Gossypium tomentosum TaxID=34277 RepID=A0A5D2NY45_GOSTO|nr:hypothetical protein ES332_A09G039900v1 [Gossypium tomentosum]
MHQGADAARRTDTSMGPVAPRWPCTTGWHTLPMVYEDTVRPGPKGAGGSSCKRGGTGTIHSLLGTLFPAQRSSTSEAPRAESQWIVAARPLCHLQYPIAYLSHLQRILPTARWELRSKEAPTTCPPRSLHLRHVPLGAKGPYCGSAIGRRARASLLAWILT